MTQKDASKKQEPKPNTQITTTTTNLCQMGATKSKEETTPPSFEFVQEDWPWVWAIWEPEILDWKIGLSDEEIQETALRQAQLPVPITENLFLGNAFSVESTDKLKARGITAVLNMAGPMALKRKTIQAYKKHGIQYKRIDGEDEYDYPLLQNHWQEASDFIKSTTENGKGKCVVHCVAGLNRSGLIAAAYYMIATQTSVLEAAQHVRKQRGNHALCNQGFQAQLVALARKHDLLGPEPGTEESIVKQTPPTAKGHYVFPTPRENPLDKYF
eukprot:CAMPEP_0113638192 /NCGR_PEP_ID=MMETSP0017_2-20120614/19998_1 /TAXON_ID=2856 /ORGANISM="Cylindrotheca closterium" /LENGTH=270 /DNA_ID=CAMNT_0000549269 /DNA_START=858 /DNA_END=1670 /DNA_ORIENTATION=+ /assembly_acc=CAM_ASM_000147